MLHPLSHLTFPSKYETWETVWVSAPTARSDLHSNHTVFKNHTFSLNTENSQVKIPGPKGIHSQVSDKKMEGTQKASHTHSLFQELKMTEERSISCELSRKSPSASLCHGPCTHSEVTKATSIQREEWYEAENYNEDTEQASKQKHKKQLTFLTIL